MLRAQCRTSRGAHSVCYNLPSLTTLEAGVSLTSLDPAVELPAALEMMLGEVCLPRKGGDNDRFARLPVSGGDLRVFVAEATPAPFWLAAAAEAAAVPDSRSKYSIHRLEKDSLAAKSIDSPPPGVLPCVLLLGTASNERDEEDASPGKVAEDMLGMPDVARFRLCPFRPSAAEDF